MWCRRFSAEPEGEHMRAATTTAVKMVGLGRLALLKVRTAVIAARDGGGGESMAVTCEGSGGGSGAPRQRRTSGGASRHVE